MTDLTLTRRRLHSHHLTGALFQTPAEAVGWLGAMQGQEYLAARWAVGVRTAGATEASVEAAVAAGEIIRTWAMRGTLQLVAAADIRWLIDLVGPPAIARHAPALRKLGLDEAGYAAAEPVLMKLLRGQTLTRAEVFAGLEARGIATAGQRGYYILSRAGMRGRLCLGPLRGKQETYTLLDDVAPPAEPLPREQALAELARRYFTSHGPATLADYAWWAGLSMAEARAGLAGAREALAEHAVEGQAYWEAREGPAARTASGAHLLPAFDEFVLGYTDRTAVLDARYSPRVMSKNGIFYPTLMVDGEVLGTWKRTLKKDTVTVTLSPFAPLKPAQRQALAAAAERYGAFLGLKPVVAEARS